MELTFMKRFLAPVLAVLVMNLGFANSVSAKPGTEKDVQFAAKVKGAIVKLGIGPAARIDLRLRDGTKLKGYVAAAGDDHFVVVNEKTDVATDVPYPQVKRVKGNNLSTGAKVAIAAVIAVIAIGLIFGRLD
jgi:hypothetical protein